MSDYTIFLGFSGGRDGMTVAQEASFLHVVQSLIIAYDVREFHHGDCVGSDEKAHRLMRANHPTVHIVGHPPDNSKLRAYCDFDLEYVPAPYLVRDHEMVDLTNWLIATPTQATEVRRSGTWATIRYTRQHEHPIDIILPDGSIKEERFR